MVERKGSSLLSPFIFYIKWEREGEEKMHSDGEGVKQSPWSVKADPLEGQGRKCGVQS